MAIDAKVSFLQQIEKSCAEQLTMADIERLMIIVSDVLEDFDMRENKKWEAEEKDDLLDCFISSMRVQGRSEKTIARYEYLIGRFMKFAKAPTRRITAYHVRNWLSSEKARGIQESTLEGSRQVLSSYFGWLKREELIERNPIANVGTIKVPKKKKKTYTPVDMELLFKHCRNLRDRAIIHFLQTTGCRVSEMTELNRDQIDLQNQECIVHGKGDKERVVYFDSVTAMILEEYLNGRTDDNPALFAGKGAKRLQPGGVRNMLKKIAKDAGVEHVHPHKFRRTLATELARHGMPIQEVSHLLGHEKLDTTMQYVVQQKDDVRNDYRRYA